MAGELKAAFDNIRAEEGLKKNTLSYLRREMQKNSNARNPSKRPAITFASVAFLLLSALLSFNIYFEPKAYVDLDVNPSIELTLNRFDRVIGSRAYNDTGEDILAGLKLNHMNYNDVLLVLMEAIDKKGYITDDGLVSVTLQTDNTGSESKLLADIRFGVNGYMAGNHHNTQVEVYTVSNNIRRYADEFNISPARYLAIQELIEADPTITMESCRGHSLNEIRLQTTKMSNHHQRSHHGRAYE